MEGIVFLISAVLGGIYLFRVFLKSVSREGFAGKVPEPNSAISEPCPPIEDKSTEEMLTEVIRFGIHRQGAEQAERFMLSDIQSVFYDFYEGAENQRNAPAIEEGSVPVGELKKKEQVEPGTGGFGFSGSSGVRH